MSNDLESVAMPKESDGPGARPPGAEWLVMWNGCKARIRLRPRDQMRITYRALLVLKKLHLLLGHGAGENELAGPRPGNAHILGELTLGRVDHTGCGKSTGVYVEARSGNGS